MAAESETLGAGELLPTATHGRGSRRSLHATLLRSPPRRRPMPPRHHRPRRDVTEVAEGARPVADSEELIADQQREELTVGSGWRKLAGGEAPEELHRRHRCLLPHRRPTVFTHDHRERRLLCRPPPSPSQPPSDHRRSFSLPTRRHRHRHLPPSPLDRRPATTMLPTACAPHRRSHAQEMRREKGRKIRERSYTRHVGPTTASQLVNGNTPRRTKPPRKPPRR